MATDWTVTFDAGDPKRLGESMNQAGELVRTARRIIDSNSYLTLATADAHGKPWASPVWFACDNYIDFIWISRQTTRHSVNISERPQVGLVIFDSTAPIGSGQGVYVEAFAEKVPESDLESALAIFSAASVAEGGGHWQLTTITGAAEFRLYRAEASAHFLLDDRDSRIPVDPSRS